MVLANLRVSAFPIYDCSFSSVYGCFNPRELAVIRNCLLYSFNFSLNHTIMCHYDPRDRFYPNIDVRLIPCLNWYSCKENRVCVIHWSI